MPSPTSARRPERFAAQPWQLATRAPEPAELLGPAPELREEFGTQAEHFQVTPRGEGRHWQPLADGIRMNQVLRCKGL